MTVRPIRPSDESNYREIVAHLSAEDRYSRFLHAVSVVDADEIRRFVSPTADFIGFIALDEARPLGAAHAWIDAGAGTAEFAVVVAGDARHQGIAHALLARVIEAVTTRGCPRLVAYAFADNGPMTHLAHDFGMRLRRIENNVATWTLDLQRGVAA